MSFGEALGAHDHGSATLARNHVPKSKRRRDESKAQRRRFRPKAPRNISPMGGLRAYKPDQWEKAVRDALRRTANNIAEAAKILGIGRVQMFRWLRDPRFADLERPKAGRKPRT